MWTVLIKYILRNRNLNLTIIGVITAFMAFMALKVQMSYEYAQMLPESDSVNVEYQNFKSVFGEEGSVFFVGYDDTLVKNYKTFTEWNKIIEQVQNIEGVSGVFHIGNCFNLEKDTAAKKLITAPVFKEIVTSQAQLDSLLSVAYSLPFYDGFLFNKESGIGVLMIWIQNDFLNTSNRTELIKSIKDPIENFGQSKGVEMHYSGMPYIRTVISEMIQRELISFMFLAIAVAAIILLFFFRSLKALAFSLLVVVIGVIWTLGTLAIFGYEITILSGIIPPILIIIGIENCIYLITKYHTEYISHGNQAKALARVVQKVGYATLLTNVTTAVGFGSFMITGNAILVEFGIVASINIILMFVFTLILIPTLYSFYAPPSARHTKHLTFNWMKRAASGIVGIIQYHRPKALIAVIILILMSGYGIYRLENKGSMVDDIPVKNKMYKDLKFFEENLSGVLPVEITIDTKKNKGLFSINTLNRINTFQEKLLQYPDISKPLSIVEVVKFSKQAFYGGRPEMYSMPNQNEKNFILSYLPDVESGDNKSQILNSFVDTNFQIARISLRIKNLYTPEIAELKSQLRVDLDSIFPTDRFTTHITGSTIVFQKGSEYLVRNLIYSLLLAIGIISILMFLMFNSIQMVMISMISNLLPLIATAGMMGLLGIDLKPSTIIIYSISLGIAVDAAIHLLSRYRQQLRITNWNVKESILNAVSDTANGMIYSGVVLVFGFAVFILSGFGGTQSLGYLIGFTLFVAMFANLIILPSLVLYFDKRATTKSFGKPVFDILDEEEEEDK
ncbi:MAG: MMPL family transporter [Bacteroidales bacterium]|nr:MMPL family transporter [Bacteroidales bacterium]